MILTTNILSSGSSILPTLDTIDMPDKRVIDSQVRLNMNPPYILAPNVSITGRDLSGKSNGALGGMP